MFRPLLFSLLLASALAVPLKVCLDGCVCELDEENPVIHCENGDRTELYVPKEPLSVFEIIAIPCNDLRSLPSPTVLKTFFPDLKAIDVEGNAHFNCSQLPEFEENMIVVTSDCGKEKKFVCEEQTKDCDWKCRTLDRIKAMWKKFKEMMQKKAKDWQLEEAMQNVQDWFSQAFVKVSKSFSS